MSTPSRQKLCFTFLIFIFLTQGNVFCWDTDDLELFDLVEEVNQNFYELLGVSNVSGNSLSYCNFVYS